MSRPSVRPLLGGLLLLSVLQLGCAGWPCPGPAAIMAERRAKAEAQGQPAPEAAPAAGAPAEVASPAAAAAGASPAAERKKVSGIKP